MVGGCRGVDPAIVAWSQLDAVPTAEPLRATERDRKSQMPERFLFRGQSDDMHM